MNKHVEERTKKAVLALQENKPLETIRVMEICALSQITRMTFYRHFQDRDALYDTIFSSILCDSLRLMMGASGIKHGLIVRLEYLNRYQRFLTAYAALRKTLDYQTAVNEETRLLEMILAAHGQSGETIRPLLYQLSGGWHCLLDKWIHDSMQTDSAVMAKWMTAAIVPEIQTPLTHYHQKIAVSSCLGGIQCKYNGGSNEHLSGAAIGSKAVFLCPETLGGLPIPRPCSEIRHYRVINEAGQDVTEAFHRGAKIALEKAQEAGCTLAILKSKSPSCGYHGVYDGTFTHTLTEGHGIAAALFEQAKIPIITEQEWEWIHSFSAK